MDLMNLFISYDHAGFKEAVANTDDKPFPLSQYDDVLGQLLLWGNHDLNLGLCDSFQIYNESGLVVFNSENREAA